MQSGHFRITATAWLLAAIAFAVVSATIDDYGLTIDEPINLGHGKTMMVELRKDPNAFWTSVGIARIWAKGHEHPPLARILIGCGESLADANPLNPQLISVRGGRWASAIAFAGIVWLAVRSVGRFAGWLAGFSAGLAIALLPRLFAHAHIASPEVISAFFIFWASIASTRMLLFVLETDYPFARKLLAVLLSALLLGLALLTKLTAVLVVPIVGLVGLWCFGMRSLPLVVIWGLLGSAAFIGGWPWLWPIDIPGHPAGWNGTIERLREFLLTGSKRAPVYVWYLDRQYASNAVPWHFAPVFFAVTVPVTTHFFAILGTLNALWVGRRKPELAMLLIGTLVSVGFFVSSVHRYDSERIFLFAFPFYGALAGVGLAAFQSIFWRSLQWLTGIIFLVVLVYPAHIMANMHPFEMSFYSHAVEGLRGADRMGLEATYWGETITPRLLNALAERANEKDQVVVLPTLYVGHAAYQGTQATSRKEIVFLPGDAVSMPRSEVAEGFQLGEPVQWAIVFNRRGYVIDPMPSKALETGKIEFEESHDGVWLARILKLPVGWRKLERIQQ